MTEARGDRGPRHVVGYADKVIQQNLNFQVRRGEVFVILGGRGAEESSRRT
jgi:ABC-type transporter Mla maintaining outer membrane lipid asymmetry ATPase subunit MlaF